MNGLLLIDKPAGITSFGIVARLRSLTGIKRIGHAGTLDPLATGLMLLLLGSATKQAQALLKLDKSYAATIRLGWDSTTGDEEGEKTQVSDVIPALPQVERVLAQFQGQLTQVPPQYSAIKVQGQPAYKLARKGQKVSLEPRPIEIYHLELLNYEYPEVKISTSVSSGTYIRSLAADIGRALATGGYLSELRRTQIGSYIIEDAIPLDGLTKAKIEQILIPL